MTTTPTIDGIDKALSHLNYRNEASAKYRLVMTLRQYYVSEKSPASLKTIPEDAAIQAIWGLDSKPLAVRAKLKNFNSVKSSVNADLNRLYAKGLNPEGVIIGPSNTFVISDRAKDAILSSIAGAVSQQDQPATTSIQQVARALDAVKEILAHLKAASIGGGKGDQPELDKVYEQLSQALAVYRSMRHSPANVHATTEVAPISTNYASNDSLQTAGAPDDSSPNAVASEQHDHDAIGFAPKEATRGQGAGGPKPRHDLSHADDHHLEHPDGPIPAGAIAVAPEALADGTDETSSVRDEDAETISIVEMPSEMDEAFELEEVDVIDELVERPAPLMGSEEGSDASVGDNAGGQADEGHQSNGVSADNALGTFQLDGYGGCRAQSHDAPSAMAESQPVDTAQGHSSGIMPLAPDDSPGLADVATAPHEVFEVDEVNVSDEPVELPAQDRAHFDEKSDGPAQGELPVGEFDPDRVPKDAPPLKASVDPDNEISEVERKRLLSERFDGYLGALERFYNQYFYIPAGEYLTGAPTPQKDECPQRKWHLPGFFIGKFPVTNALFEVFVERTGYQTSAERRGSGTVYRGRFHRRTDKVTGQPTAVWHAATGKAEVPGACWYQPSGPGSTLHNKRNHPVVQVSYRDAMAFAAWIGKRLPSEAEWEAAARTHLGYPYPWGEQWQAGYCNIEESSLADTSPVDQYPQAVNTLSIADAMGNVMEWTAEEFVLPPMPSDSGTYRVAKGGSYISNRSLRLWSRFRFDAGFTCNILGFRCVAD